MEPVVKEPFNVTNIIMIVGFIVCCIVVLLLINKFFMYRTQSTIKNVTDLSKMQDLFLQDRVAGFNRPAVSGFADLGTAQTGLDLSGTPASLINIQTFATKQAGYIGPLSAGVFNEDIFTLNALKAGCRTFLFQIDYYEGDPKDKALFPAPNYPCLLYRDDSGSLISLNAGSILNMATYINLYAFNNIVPSNTDPIVILLYGLRAPDPITKPKDYLTYCSNIALQLKPLTSKMLDPTYRRQGNEIDLFRGLFSTLENRVIILSNFDTSLFRNKALFSQLNIPSYNHDADLDYIVNARLYTDETKNIGITGSSPTDKKTYGRIATSDTLVSLSPEDQTRWATKNADTFTVVLPKSMTDLSFKDTQTLIKKTGVNVLPIDPFFQDIDDTKRLFTLWNTSTWTLKPYALMVDK